MRGGWVIRIVVINVAGYAVAFGSLVLVGSVVLYVFGRHAENILLWVFLGLVMVGAVVGDLVKEWRRRAAVRRVTGKEEW